MRSRIDFALAMAAACFAVAACVAITYRDTNLEALLWALASFSNCADSFLLRRWYAPKTANAGDGEAAPRAGGK
jgi:hypothetical protein